jgi:hypothetical protein
MDAKVTVAPSAIARRKAIASIQQRGFPITIHPIHQHPMFVISPLEREMFVLV